MSPEERCAAHWTAWEGTETEGRLSGLPTLFLGVVGEGADVVVAEAARYEHVYVNPIAVETGGWPLVRRIADLVPITTLALTPALYERAPDDLFARCHVVLVLDLPRRMKPTDEVRLDLGPYHVMTAPAWAFLETVPAQYDADRGVVARRGVRR